MKTAAALSLFCLLFVGCLSAVGQGKAWPRNAKTGKVELRGVVPFPSSVKTEAQRKDFAVKWYMSHLTTASGEQVAAQAKTNLANGLLTYAGLPRVAGIDVGSDSLNYSLVYSVELKPTKTGLSYTLTDLNITTPASEVPKPLAMVISRATEADKVALRRLREAIAEGVWVLDGI